MMTPTRNLFSCLGVLAALAAVTAPAFAQTGEATVAMVLVNAQGNCEALTQAAPTCATPDLKIEGDLYTPYYAVLCVMNADPDKGIAGLSMGVDYDNRSGSGVDVIQWTVCADGLEFPSSDYWPAAGTGTRITWTTCQQQMPDGLDGRVTAIAGYFYISAYSPDQFSIVKNPVQSGSELKVAECDPPAEFDIKPEHTGILGFSDDGSEKGRLECAKIQTVSTTWGRVKEMYGNR
jgi:hypothetical protein